MFLGGPCVCHRTCEHVILKTNEPILMQMSTSCPWDKGINNPLLGQLVKVTPGQNRSQKSISARFSKNYPMNFHQIWQAHITVNARCVTMTQIQKAGQCHTRLKINLEVWWRHHSQPPPPESSSFSSSIL